MSPRLSLERIALFGTLLFLMAPGIYVHGQTSSEEQVLQVVNNYRTQVVGIPALVYNDMAACVGQQIVQKFVGTPCDNETGADTQYQNSPQYADFPTLLSNCKVDLQNVTTGFIAIDCIPTSVNSSDAPNVAAQNFTMSLRYQESINSTSFTSAGVGTSANWYSLVLATNTSTGDYGFTGTNNNSAFLQRVEIPVPVQIFLALLTAFWASLNL